MGMFKEEQSEIDAAYSNEAAGVERVAAVEALLLQSSRRHRDFIERHTQPHKRPPTNMAMVRGSLAGRRSESRNMRNRQDRDAMERERRQLLERLEAIEREERRERERQQNFDGGAELEQRAKKQGFKIRKPRFVQSIYRKGGSNGNEFNEWGNRFCRKSASDSAHWNQVLLTKAENLLLNRSGMQGTTFGQSE